MLRPCTMALFEVCICAALTGLGFAQEAAPSCDGSVRGAMAPVQLPLEAPQGIAIDADGSLWICSLLSTEVIHLGPDLSFRRSFHAPFPPGAGTLVHLSGIALDPRSDTLLLVHPTLMEVWEFEKNGEPTGLIIPLDGMEPPVNPLHLPFPRGLEVDPEGADGNGSIWIIESVMTRVYEIAFDGTVLRQFCEALDPDGCPGKGGASAASDLEILRDDGGPITGFEILTGRPDRDRIMRLDANGERLGVPVIPLIEVGGRPVGFARGRLPDPVGGSPVDVIFVTVESSSELHAIRVEPPPLLPIDTIRVTASEGAVDIAWSSPGEYERFDVTRGGELVATLPGTARELRDPAPPPGILEYEVAGITGDCRASARGTTVVGSGEVLATADLSDLLAAAGVEATIVTPLAIAEDLEENLWITDGWSNRLLVLTKRLELVTHLAGPFQEPEDELTAIASNPDGDGGLGSLFVYNNFTHVVQELSGSGEKIGEPFPSGVFSDPEDLAIVSAMLFNPGGDGGVGSFWYLDFARASIEEHRRDGSLVRACTHPDQIAEPPPDRTIVDALTWGMTFVPGSNFTRMELTGGRVRDLATTRIFELDLDSCVGTGAQIPVEGAGQGALPTVLAIHRSVHEGRSVIFAVYPSTTRPRVLEISAEQPAVPRVEDIACVQESDLSSGGNGVRLRFRAPPGVEGIEVLRDGALLVALPGDAGDFLDPGAPSGLVRYEVRCVLGGARGDARRCEVWAGVGSIEAREFAAPGIYLHELAHDPIGRRYVAAGNSGAGTENLYIYGEDLRFQGQVPSPFGKTRQVATLAVRAAGAASEVYCMGWNPGASPGTQKEFPLEVIGPEGARLRSFVVTPPPPLGGYVSFPSGMVWDRATDTFWYVERNARALVNMTPEGETLATFPHPAENHQDGVIDYGIAVDADRGVLYVSAAGRYDFDVTKLIEITPHGVPTGVEMPLKAGFYDRSWGFAVDTDGYGFVVASAVAHVWDLVRYRAFPRIPPIQGLSCSAPAGGIELAWTNGSAYDAIRIYRGAELVASIEGTGTTWSEAYRPMPGEPYRVAPVVGELEGPGSVCVAVRPLVFLRGDVEVNGEINITDAISILGFLFIGGDEPACLDAADVNDDAEVNITDGIALLGFLFLSGAAPAPPFPSPGYDTTPDGTLCEG